MQVSIMLSVILKKPQTPLDMKTIIKKQYNIC